MTTSVETLYQLFTSAGKVSTDTRKIEPGSVFFALKGPNFNGNTYALEALAKGASYAVVDEKEYATDERIHLVDDVLESLQQLASYHRRRLGIPILAIGGSNGKTTTKELVAAVLSQKYNTFATKGNLNNHIGVPLTLLSLSKDVEVAIIEMGANGHGEIELLCQIADPTHGIITNIGLDHLEGFGDIEGVARANSELYYHLLKREGVVFVNTLEDHLTRMAARFKETVTYPSAGNYYHCTLIPGKFFVELQAEDGSHIKTNIVGDYNFNNIATALCIGKYFGVDPAKAHEAVANYRPANNRSQLLKTERNTILLDAYNANPSSMQAAVENLARLEAPYKALILGDMLEMGKDSEKEHRNMGKLIQSLGVFELVLLCGEEMLYAHQEAPGSKHFAKKADLVAWLTANPLEGASILIKGSRGMSLETLVTQL
jgi:UDP-N-acetylmuramoyl-tripeptide--D-alanyl-D-alanine ligase